MTTFKDKRIFEGNIADGNPCRQEYLESINKFIDKGFADACQQRDKFAGNKGIEPRHIMRVLALPMLFDLRCTKAGIDSMKAKQALSSFLTEYKNIKKET